MTEAKIEDTVGKFISPIACNEKRFRDAKWSLGRIILSNKNIWMIGKGKKKKIVLNRIFDVGGRFDISTEVKMTPYYLLVRHYGPKKENLISLVTSGKKEEFEKLKDSLHGILLNGKIVLVKYPVKKGGVLQRDVKWEKAQMAVKGNKLRMVTQSGKIIKIDLDKTQLVKKEEREVNNQKKRVLDVQFSEEEDDMDFSIEAYIHGPPSLLNILYGYIYGGFDKVTADISLSEAEKQIIMSLYTGVSPFEIPGFLGLDVGEVEDIYDRLIETGILKEVRKRKEVILTTRGKNFASGALGSE